MINIENVEVTGWEAAIRGMRNPLNSWDKSDSVFCHDNTCGTCNNPCDFNEGVNWEDPDANYCIGEADLDLMKRLAKAGTDHAKYRRFINVTADIIAPLYWWKEYDTYKVGTVANSCSTMHKIQAKEFTINDFSCEAIEELGGFTKGTFRHVIRELEDLRTRFNNTGDKKYWKCMIQLLPSSYNQRRTVQLNYEVLANIYKSRRSHKLDEWRKFCTFIDQLPYSELITGGE